MLVVAGAFKRAEPDLAEDALLMRALRDFNIPKIVREDEVVFFGLLGETLKEYRFHLSFEFIVLLVLKHEIKQYWIQGMFMHRSLPGPKTTPRAWPAHERDGAMEKGARHASEIPAYDLLQGAH